MKNNTPPTPEEKKERKCLNCNKETPDTPCPYCGGQIFKVTCFACLDEKGRNTIVDDYYHNCTKKNEAKGWPSFPPGVYNYYPNHCRDAGHSDLYQSAKICITCIKESKQSTPPTPDKLAEAREILEWWPKKFGELVADLETIPGVALGCPYFISDLLKAQDLLSRAEQKKEILNRIKAEHDKYCGKLEKKDDWFEIAINKINS